LEVDDAAVVDNGVVGGFDDLGEAPAGLAGVAFFDVVVFGAVVDAAAFAGALVPDLVGGDDGDDVAVGREFFFEVGDLFGVAGAVDDDQGKSFIAFECVDGASCPDVFAFGFAHGVGDLADGFGGEGFALCACFFPDEVTHADDGVAFGFGDIDGDGFAGEGHSGEDDDFHWCAFRVDDGMGVQGERFERSSACATGSLRPTM
jgi:hypothetical protein